MGSTEMLRSVAEEYIKVCDPMFPDESWADLNEDEQSEILKDLAKMYKKAALDYGCTVKDGRLYDRSGQEFTESDEYYRYVYDPFLDNVIAKYGGKEWYAVIHDGEDYDHGNGAYDYDEAVRMLREMVANGYPDAMIAVIDPKDDLCSDLIGLEEVDGHER